jgi:phosphohistidine swiveling domain-containing protein
MGGSPIAQGTLVSGSGCEGTVQCANTVAEVIGLMQEDLSETILLTDSPSATAVVPLLQRVRGLICRSGGTTSHLAIVSREFGLTCVMGAALDDPAALVGRRVAIGADGGVRHA